MAWNFRGPGAVELDVKRLVLLMLAGAVVAGAVALAGAKPRARATPTGPASADCRVREILANLESLKDVSHCVRHHHERWDGGGYPDGLRGTDIPFASRVIAVADTIDALITDRPYRKGFPVEKVIEVLREESRRQLDPELVGVAVEFLEPEHIVDDETVAVPLA